MITKRYIDNSKEVSVEDAIALLKGEAQGLYDWFNGWRINCLTGEWLHEETGITGAEVDEIDQAWEFALSALEDPDCEFWFELCQWFMGDLNPNSFG